MHLLVNDKEATVTKMMDAKARDLSSVQKVRKDGYRKQEISYITAKSQKGERTNLPDAVEKKYENPQGASNT
jgi:hypothetical protein